jgi:hypothetical protein
VSARIPREPVGWYLCPEALAIIDSIRANPPRMVRALAPLSQVFAGGDEYVMRFDRNDPRVDELRILSDEAFRAAERACGDTRAVADAWPDLDDVIRRALDAVSAPVRKMEEAA